MEPGEKFSLSTEKALELHAVVDSSICVMKRNFLLALIRALALQREDRQGLHFLERSLTSFVKPQICRLPCSLRHPWILNRIPPSYLWWLPLASRLKGHAAISLPTPSLFLSLSISLERPLSFTLSHSVVWKQEGGYSTEMCCRTLVWWGGQRHLTFLLHASLGERKSIGGLGGGASR